jgi:hypothetical protein
MTLSHRARSLARRTLSVLVISLFAVLGAATSKAPEEGEGAGEPTGSAPAQGEQARSAALQALEAHLASGETYGEGPDAQVIAAAAREALAPGDGVAVKVVPGAPRHITVLVRYRSDGGYENLREISQSERDRELDRILDAVDGGYEAGADVIGLAIRGPFAYGAIAVRRPGQSVEYHTGTVISTSPLDPILTAAPGEEPARTIAPGAPAIEGRLQPAPYPQPSYHLTLSEPRAVRVQLRSTRPEAQAPIVLLCRGGLRASQCEESVVVEPTDNVPEDVLDQQAQWVEQAEARGHTFHEDVYRLPAGTYTVGVFRNECPESQPACPAATADYDLRLF